ncbi:unnamed protein product, partial [marine sediment metagenome]
NRISGSAGLAIILNSSAVLFVDGRYKIQAGYQVDQKLLEIQQIPDAKPEAWIEAYAKRKSKIGYDPRLHTLKNIQNLTAKLDSEHVDLVPVKRNLIDVIWNDRPSEPSGTARLHPFKYSGQRTADKLAGIKRTLRNSDVDALLLTQPDSIAWLFNIRGKDIRHTPVVLCHAIIHSKKKPELFINPVKTPSSLTVTLKKYSHLRLPKELAARLKQLGQAHNNVQIDPDKTPAFYTKILVKSGGRLIEAVDPCTLPKSIKNSAEITGVRHANIRDGVAVSRFLCWLEENTQSSTIDEIGAAKKL